MHEAVGGSGSVALLGEDPAQRLRARIVQPRRAEEHRHQRRALRERRRVRQAGAIPRGLCNNLKSCFSDRTLILCAPRISRTEIALSLTSSFAR